MPPPASASPQIRPATPADLAAILAIEQAIPEAPHWTPDAYAAFVISKPGALLRRSLVVAVMRGELAGFAAATYLPGDNNAALESIAVTLAFRGTGTAEALFAAAVSWSQQQGATGIALEVRPSNRRAVRFYGRMGFVSQGLRRSYYRDPVEDAVLMSRICARVGHDEDL